MESYSETISDTQLRIRAVEFAINFYQSNVFHNETLLDTASDIYNFISTKPTAVRTGRPRRKRKYTRHPKAE